MHTFIHTCARARAPHTHTHTCLHIHIGGVQGGNAGAGVEAANSAVISGYHRTMHVLFFQPYSKGVYP